jgi:hypothetical protein
MPNLNVVSSNSVTGNIGSCETKTTGLTSYQDFFTYRATEISTNSCTGEVKSYEHFGGITFDFALTIILLIGLGFIVLNVLYSRSY